MGVSIYLSSVWEWNLIVDRDQIDESRESIVLYCPVGFVQLYWSVDGVLQAPT